jgi:hypothetical protein
MADYHQYVDGIRAVLQSGQLPEEGTLRELADGYARACTESNERLTSCTRLLHQGLRAEAIHQAEIEPNLLSTLTSLDFPERAEWDALTEEKGLVRPQALNLDAATALNEAYAQHDPLRELLRRHRRMALAQTSLAKRLALLRVIANQDPDTPIWREDIQKYEQTRLLQVRAEADRAATSCDTATLQSLVAELEDTRWSTRPSAALARKVCDDLTQVRKVQARRALETVVESLHRAYEAKNIDEARGLYNQWGDLAPLAQLADNDPLCEHARPELTWVEELNQQETDDRAFAAAVEALRTALDQDDSDYDTLTERGEAVSACGRGIPRELAVRLNPRLKELTMRWWRRTLAACTAAIAVTSVLMFILIQMVITGRQDREAKVAAAHINQLLDQKRTEQAEVFYSKQDKSVAGRPAMVEAWQRLQADVKDKKLRSEKWARLLVALDRREPDLSAPPELGELKQLVVTKEDKIAFDEASLKYGVRFDAARRDAEAEYGRDLDKVRAEVDNLEGFARGSIASPEIDRLSAEIRTRLKPLLDNVSEKIRDEARKSARAIGTRLDVVEKSRRSWKRQIELERELGRTSVMTAGDPAPFTSALKKYADEFPGTSLGKDAQQVLKEQPIWGGVLAWAKAAEAWRTGPPLLDVKPKAAADRVVECQGFLAAYANSPYAKLAGEYQKYLEAVARREGLAKRTNGKESGVRTELEAVWNDPFACKLKVLVTDDKQRHYFFEEPVESRTSRKYLFIVKHDLDEKIKPVSIFKAHIGPEGPAPQCAIAAKISKQDLLQKKGWEEAIFEILQGLYGTPPGQQIPFEPIYQLYLLKMTVDLGVEGSTLLESALEPLSRYIAMADIDEKVDWMNPDDRPARTERAKANDYAGRLPSLAEAMKKAREDRERLERGLSRWRTSVGWLARDGTVRRFRRGPGALPAGTELWVAYPAASGQDPWQKIGTARTGEPGFDAAGTEAKVWLEGRPVFADVGPTVPAQ